MQTPSRKKALEGLSKLSVSGNPLRSIPETTNQKLQTQVKTLKAESNQLLKNGNKYKKLADKVQEKLDQSQQQVSALKKECDALITERDQQQTIESTQLKNAQHHIAELEAQLAEPLALSDTITRASGITRRAKSQCWFWSWRRGNTLTMPDGKQYRVIPAPQDPMALSEALGGSTVVIGKRGDVLIGEVPDRTRQRGEARLVAIFEPFIEPAPEDICVEITPEEIVCNFDKFPERF